MTHQCFQLISLFMHKKIFFYVYNKHKMDDCIWSLNKGISLTTQYIRINNYKKGFIHQVPATWIKQHHCVFSKSQSLERSVRSKFFLVVLLFLLCLPLLAILHLMNSSQQAFYWFSSLMANCQTIFFLYIQLLIVLYNHASMLMHSIMEADNYGQPVRVFSWSDNSR